MRMAMLLVLVGGVLAGETRGAGPVVSGPGVGKRPGPYSFVLCTGSERGKSHCYVCETADRPAVIVFTRNLSDSLGKLVHQLDKELIKHRADELKGWVTILHPDQSKLDSEVLKWAKKHAVATTPVGVFEDVYGPPSYRIHQDADVTVLLSVKQKVVANFAFRAGELDEKGIAEVLRAIPKIVKGK